MSPQCEPHPNESVDKHGKKRNYNSPRLVQYGSVRELTKNGSGSQTESNCGHSLGNTKACSERRIKENIVRIGTHPTGFGLYLFDYQPNYRAKWGHAKQFGVMIDEVETVMPDAVSVGADGYKLVDYNMLGINRTTH